MSLPRPLLATLSCLVFLASCGHREPREEEGSGASRFQAEADLLGRELFDVVDRVMAYKTSHRNRLPASLREAGLDSLTPLFVRRLGRAGNDPLVTVAFRKSEDRGLRSCWATNLVLEEALVNGAWEVTCDLVGGGSRTFTVKPPPQTQKQKGR
ncbi:MAG TPA: hypothetical protein VNJ71_01235 [Gemmatimonadales bacterium]|nr:hypothetical protein [Gemmatimonadales bacterium]